MAKISAKNAVISVDDSAGTPRDISADCKSYEIEYGVDPLDITGFGEGSKNYTPGMRVIGVTLEVFWNKAATTGAYTVLKSIVASTSSKTVSILPETAGETLSGEYMIDKIGPKAGVDGVIELGSIHFSVMGAVAPAWA